MSLLRNLLLFACMIGFAAGVSASDLNELRARMSERLPEVVQLLRLERVGENNQGFLSRRGGLSEDEEKVFSAENTDRQALYAILAQRERLKPEEVGRAQARQLARLSAKGFWIQDEEGEWYQKQ
jgi:uncharacterized protein YdbL (DUF1318 family)